MTDPAAPPEPERTDPAAPRIFQTGQPAGVPPLELTGERTLPDVPEENYWFQRHLVVYDWIRTRVGGQRVVDMACGEGYGTDVLARTAADVVGVDANLDAFEHARAKYARPGVRFVRTLIEHVRRAARRRRVPADDRARARIPATSSGTSPGSSPAARGPRSTSRRPTS